MLLRASSHFQYNTSSRGLLRLLLKPAIFPAS
nr:MAG TPA: hypothetical protein [Caudoviricetes sp.]